MRTTVGGSDDEWGRIVLPRTSAHVEYAESLEDAVRRGVLDRPADKRESNQAQQEDPSPRVIAAFVDDAGLLGGASEGCQVPQQWIEWGRKVLTQRRRPGDEVRLGLYLGTAKEMNVYGASEVLRSNASREQMVLNLESEVRSFAKHMRLPVEDAEIIVRQKLGISRMSELDSFTSDDLLKARSAVREMTIEVLRTSVSV
jgi:hypothetical protein